MLRIVEIKALPDGGHRSQGYHGEVMDGYALIPADMETPNFPFGEVEAELLPFGEPDPETGAVEKVMTVTKWTPGEVPEPVPMSEPEPTTDEVLNTLLGVSNDE